jgi:hypothetical protein
MSALANSFITGMGGKATFIHTIPAKPLAPRIIAPTAIKGDHRSIEIPDWAGQHQILLDALYPAER